MAKDMDVLGFPVSFDRRRYGTTTFTWAHFKVNDEWISLGDPVPSVHWKRSELERAIQCELDYRKGLPA